MKPFKFFRGDTLPEVNLEIVSREVQMLEVNEWVSNLFVRSTEHIPAGFVYVPIRYEGWEAHQRDISYVHYHMRENVPLDIVECGEIGAYREGIDASVNGEDRNCPYSDELRMEIWNRGYYYMLTH
jgi:hypothetical protein